MYSTRFVAEPIYKQKKLIGAFYLHKDKLIYFFINYTKCWQIDVFVSFCVERNLILRGNNL